jgi:putative nucleotidyltransferase with HDIG domain
MVAQSRAVLPEEQKPSDPDLRQSRWPLWLFVGAITVLGAAVVDRALLDLAQLTPGMALLAVITVAAGRFRIKVPGHSATVSVSEVFVFASILLYGPAVATLVVAIDGLWISLNQSRRRVYRALFNIAEPAVSTGLAGLAFFAVYAAPPPGLPSTGAAALMLPTIAMAVVYFSLNSTLTAVAVALESGGSALRIWRGHALYLAMNYYAAASIAALVVKGESGLNLGIAGLIAPLVVLSYGAYKASASRMQDANRHLNEVERLYHATVETLAIAVDAKDQVTHGHIRRVQRHTVAVARALGITGDIEIRALEAASLLHDVGKLAVPDYVLNKPGALTHAEFECIKLHATKGAEILSTVEFPYAVVPVVRHHHEQWNGKGYPDGLAGEDIPFGARILTVVDCFDAVTSDRPYRRKMSDEEGIGVLLSRRGTMYDPRVVDAFVQLIPGLRHADRLAEGGRTPHASPDPLAEAPPVVRQEPEPSPMAIEPASFPAPCGRLIRERLSAIPGAEACVFAIASSGDVLTAVYATPAVREAVAPLRILVGEGLAGWVAVNRHTIANSHADLDLGPSAAQIGLKACTATPIFASGELAGVLSVYLRAPRRFSDEELRAAGRLAQEVGLSLVEREIEMDRMRTPAALAS